jgi:hypothetical protein
MHVEKKMVTGGRVSRGVSEKMGKGGVLWYGEQAQVAG